MLHSIPVVITLCLIHSIQVVITLGLIHSTPVVLTLGLIHSTPVVITMITSLYLEMIPGYIIHGVSLFLFGICSKNLFKARKKAHLHHGPLTVWNVGNWECFPNI